MQDLVDWHHHVADVNVLSPTALNSLTERTVPCHCEEPLAT